jgi:hypothetical protein
MISIDDTLISDDLVKTRFVCDLASCKGACCVEGDSGAPLEEEELAILDDIYVDVKPYMVPAGIEVVEQNGKYTIDSDGDFVTPLVNNRECAYVFYDEKGVTKCAIEKAHIDGKIDFKKPISCHLFPVRLNKYSTFTAVNIQSLDICQAAFTCGNKLQVPVYRFLKEPLIRKFGSDWFEALDAVAKG